VPKAGKAKKLYCEAPLMPCHYAVVFWGFCSDGLCEPPNFAFLFIRFVFSLWKTFTSSFLLSTKNHIPFEALDWGKQDAEKNKAYLQ